ncbi:DUF3558 domain-containing protein [Corynebacterium sp. p3-SID1194]|nr:DUF3558 domain-containing protein [Corynebacterium sp. p3-SID1194]
MNPAPALNSAVAETQHPSAESDVSSSTAPNPTTPSEDDPPAFHFESGDVVLGDFVYDDVKGNIFNPCEEISPEEFARIGFETEGESKRSETKDIYSCFLDKPGDTSGLSYVVIGGSANLMMAVDQGAIVETGVSDVVPSVYSYGPIGVEADICYAAVDTTRGQFAAAVGGIENVYDHDELCNRSIEILEALYQI